MTKTVEKWEVKMNQQRKLKAKGAEVLFERVSICVACFEDPEFVDWCVENGTDSLEFLDEELSDTAVNFSTLAKVLETFPTKEEWVKHNIRTMIAMVLEDQKSKKDGEPNQRVAWKERCLAAEAELEKLRLELKAIREKLESVGV